MGGGILVLPELHDDERYVSPSYALRRRNGRRAEEVLQKIEMGKTSNGYVRWIRRSNQNQKGDGGVRQIKG